MNNLFSLFKAYDINQGLKYWVLNCVGEHCSLFALPYSLTRSRDNKSWLLNACLLSKCNCPPSCCTFLSFFSFFPFTVTFPLLPPPPSHGKTLKDMAISTLVANTFSLFFLFFLMMWSIFRDQGAGDSGKSTIFKQVGRNSLLFQVWTCVCQHCCFLSLLVYVLDADKTFVSKWFWRGRAQELYLSHPCERLSDNKSMQNLKWCVGYFPFLHNLENTKCLAFVVKLLDS